MKLQKHTSKVDRGALAAPGWCSKAKARMQSRPMLERATLAQIQSGKYQINSVNPDIFNDPYVIPWVDLYCGAGGMEFGSVRKQGKFTLV